jgi:hypothetical protein
MMIKASGRSALVLATGLFVCFAGPSQAAPAGADSTADSTTAASKPETATPGKPIKLTSPNGKRYAQPKSGKEASKTTETRKASGNDVADAAGYNPSTIPPSVANANAQLTSDAPADSAKGMLEPMTAKANSVLQAAAADKPADAQAASDAAVVSSDQLNDVDRALQQDPAATPNSASTQTNSASGQTVAMASTTRAVKAAAPVLTGSNESSTWDQTSLIGKIFIAFGALLTVASAARMFMA